MAAPQVTNLAGKLLARWPALTGPELKQLIVDGAEPRDVGGRTIRLLHPQRTFELAAKHAEAVPAAAPSERQTARDPLPRPLVIRYKFVP